MSHQRKFCPECGKRIDTTSKYCIHCGASLGEDVKQSYTTARHVDKLGVGTAIERTFTMYRELFVILIIFASLAPITGIILNTLNGIIILSLYPQLPNLLDQLQTMDPSASLEQRSQILVDILDIVTSPEFLLTIGLMSVVLFIVDSIVSAVAGASLVHITDKYHTEEKQEFDISTVISQIQDKIGSIIGSQILAVLVVIGFVLGYFFALYLFIFITAQISLALASLVMLGGIVLFFVAFFYVLIRLSILTQIIVIEEKSAFEAISVSGDRINGYKWSYLGIILVLILINIGFGLFSPFFTNIGGSLGTRFYNIVTQILIFPIGVIARTLLYLNRLARS